ncbi:AAA family ATPase [Sphingomonas sp. 10B4]|uniref:AAA family ATPase n=1 Tax=Sphingomonas sp. 10B4 TaxID=3048575 RepID=UPI002AB5986B|nr:AAA family ATPase [Sphingomonas sp. 10B4]MDY7524581.1 AAA family ATPase [Sphingomonas sp. 10B4]MEB0284006.1 AAA family ATPase [Sphingomonas sp. 10B4]
MWIESIRIEGGSLDGFRQNLSPGLNVLIGGRGTGKSSVIELIRFCLGAPSSSDAMGKDAREHALGVLGDGKVVITLTNGSDRIEVSRIATDSEDNCPLEISPPFVFSQKEVEQIGARSQSRMRLVDGFVVGRGAAAAKRGPLHARIKSASTEIRSLLVEVADIAEKLLALPKLQERLADLKRQGAAQRARSTELDGLRKQLDELTPLMSGASVRAGSIGRSADDLSEWTDDLDLVAGRQPSIESWPAQAMATDQLQPHRKRLETAHERLAAIIAEYRSVIDDLEVLRRKSSDEKSELEARGREVRQKIEEQQKGASVLDRQIADLSQEIAALSALADLRTQRLSRIDRLHAQRQTALDEMHAHNAALTAGREQTATRLTAGLAPSIRVTVKPLADYRTYVSVLNGALRGSGLRYRELADRIAETFSPQEVAVLAERGEVSVISKALEINEERALRLAEGLRGDAGAELLVTEVGDEVLIELLDGTSFKSTDFLSMGQRCTAVLPIILQHNERIIVLDQPEDHLDNAFVVGTLVKAIRARGGSAQTIIATHNPNIPVLGNADFVAHLESDGDRCFVQVAGALDDVAVVNSITNIMEGGREAFQRRAAFYAERGSE